MVRPSDRLPDRDPMLLGVIADDFTGASDIANALANGHEGQPSLLTTQYFGIPSEPAGADGEAGVISLKTRSDPAAAAVRTSVVALSWLLAQGCEQVVFKYCSTFDSTPEGNIGPVGEALCEALKTGGVIACPAFPDAGRTVYQGHLFVGDRPLNESGLEHHPLNPMTDSDIRRWLQRQSRSPVGHVPWSVVRQGSTAIRAALERSERSGMKLVVVDALVNDDLIAMARAAADAALLTGGSGIAMGLAGNFAARGRIGRRPEIPAGARGAEAVLAGSCSAATRSQVTRHAASHPVIPIDAAAVIEGRTAAADVAAFLAANKGKGPLAYSSSSPEDVAVIQKRYGRERSSAALESFFAAVAALLVEAGVRRLVVAGGETSGAVVGSLGLKAVRIGREIDPGVPVLTTRDEPRLALALKSGNFGGPDFFEKALRMLEGEA